ncbi:MAG: arsenate reductase ArsC [Longicatena sp.]
MENRKLKVGFICVHNSCRSQMAEAIGKLMANETFESYSAGTKIKPQINQDANRIMKQVYRIDMEATQHSKLLTDIPQMDVIVTMGCNVECPVLPCIHQEDWGLADPSGKVDEAYLEIIQQIQTNILDLKNRIEKGVITLNV